MRITSAHNPAVKYVRSLERTSVRQRDGVYLVEGVRLTDEAWKTGQAATLALYDPAALSRTPAGLLLLERVGSWAERSYEVAPHVLAAAAQTESPSGIVAVVRWPRPEPLSFHAHDRFGLVLDRLADPGNVGTVLRTAAAAGVDYVVAPPGTADLFAPKVVRAGMGAHFRLSLYSGMAWPDILASLTDSTFVALDASASQSIYSFEWSERTALVVGGEAHGLSGEARDRISGRLRIPMRPGVESLNAAVAASIAMYAAVGHLISSVN